MTTETASVPTVRKPVILQRRTAWGTYWVTWQPVRRAGASWWVHCLDHDVYAPAETLAAACLRATKGRIGDWCAPCAVLRSGCVSCTAAAARCDGTMTA